MKSRVKIIIIYVLIFCLYFILQSKFVHDAWFGTDELDIMMGGKAIANGYTLYDDFLSQHMPFSYYISAVFDFLGATSVSAQRFCFYTFFAFFWTIIIYRYRNIVSQKALFIFPIIHMSLISTYIVGTTILSEHIAGIGAVIMFLEFMNFYEKRDLKWHNYMFLSISVILLFGTIFIGIFPIFVTGVAVICFEISCWYKDRKTLKEKANEWVKKYAPLLGWSVLPWAVLLTIYAVKGNVLNFIHEAYGINRNIYPDYIEGYGESILSVLLAIPSCLFEWTTNIITLDNFSVTTVIYLIILVLIVLYASQQFKEGKRIFAVFTIFFVSSMGTRGTFSFHSTHMVEAIALICAIYLGDCMKSEKERKIAIICSFLLLVPYWSNTSGFTAAEQEVDTTTADIIDQIVEPGEAVWQLNFDNASMMIADRPSIANVAAVPWMWKGQGSRVIDKMQTEMPQVALYNADHEVWGYKMSEYAPEMVGFMAQNYTQYEDTQIYIRNDSYDSLVKKIK